MIHSLKCWPVHFNRILDGNKKFELRKNDRDYRSRDILILNEWDPKKRECTGRLAIVTVGYILNSNDVEGLMDGYVIMSIIRKRL